MTYQRIVIKVGTSTLTDESGALDRVYIASLAMQCAAEHRSGIDMVLVSSGAIRAGIDQWESYSGQPSELLARASMPFKQAMAAIGQPLLMQAYLAAFAAYDLPVAQFARQGVEDGSDEIASTADMVDDALVPAVGDNHRGARAGRNLRCLQLGQHAPCTHARTAAFRHPPNVAVQAMHFAHQSGVASALVGFVQPIDIRE